VNLPEPLRLAFTESAIEEREMVRHYTLSFEDLVLIDRRRGDANRLRFAVLLCYLRLPGRTLRQDEQLPASATMPNVTRPAASISRKSRPWWATKSCDIDG
jgi:TnpA family transposase